MIANRKQLYNVFLRYTFCYVVQCFLCPTIMHSNTEVMEHMVTHIRPQVPGQKESPVCRYCCAVFSSKHQMTTHVTEAHSTMGRSANGDMVVCGICEQKFGESIFDP